MSLKPIVSRPRRQRLGPALLLLGLLVAAQAQAETYDTHKDLTRKLGGLARKHADVLRLQTLAESRAGRVYHILDHVRSTLGGAGYLTKRRLSSDKHHQKDRQYGDDQDDADYAMGGRQGF